jgi:tetratricopeptide (TPR) repeat protein
VTVPEQMGLEKQLTLEGLAYRVSPEPTRKEIDLETTIRNLYQVFRYDGLLDKNRNFDASVYKDDNAMKLVQNYSAAHVQVAYQLQTMGRIPEAIKALDDARKISPDFPGLLEYLARLYDGSGNAAKAESLYREGLARYPNSPEFYFHLGTMAYRRGNIEESIDLLRRATTMNQQYFDWFSALFTVYWQTGQREAALEVLRGWLRAHPEDRQTAADLAVYEDSLRILGGGEPPPRPLPGER